MLIPPTESLAHLLYLDSETVSDLDLSKVGAYRYAEHPSTRITLLPVALDDAPAEGVDLTKEAIPGWLIDRLTDPATTVAAWGSFDYILINEKIMKPLGMHLEEERYYDISGHSQMLSCAPSLSEACKQLGLPADKNKDAAGKRLIRLFCQPQLSTKKQLAAGAPATYYVTPEARPEEWNRFKEYAIQDVVAARECHKVLNTLCEWPASERQVYVDMLRSNGTGLPIDKTLVLHAKELLAGVHRDVLAKFKAATNIDSFNKIKKIKDWCAQQGFPVDSLREAVVAAYLKNKGDIPEAIVRVFELRKEQPKTAINKYKAILNFLSEDGQLRGMQRYHRAGTGRFAGVGPQIHNFPRPSKALIADMDVPEGLENEYLIKRIEQVVLQVREGKLYPGIDPHTQLKSIARSVIQAPEGYQLVVMDFSGVENRYLGWLAGCETLLKVYRAGKSLYTEFALSALARISHRTDRPARFVGGK